MSGKKPSFADIVSTLSKWVRTSLLSKDALVFLFFLLLSTGFWILHSLNKSPEVRLVVPISYINVPDDIVLSKKIPSSISVVVKDNGSIMLSHILKYKNTSLSIDLSKMDTDKPSYCITNKELKHNLLEYIPATSTLLSINPDSIPVQFTKLHKRDIPVKFNGNIALSKQYVAEEIVFNPPTVAVYGDKNCIDTIQYIYTEKTDIKHVKDTVRRKLHLEKIGNLTYSANSVNVLIPVEMYTEKVLTIPIKVKNAPGNVYVRIFPAKVNVSCHVRLSAYHSLSENSFSAMVDYRDLIKNQSGKEPLQFDTKIKSISNLHYSPEYIEFILEEKR